MRKLIQGLVSIVIPVYGAEKYLDRCISTVVEQTYKQLEILLVDDASPDRCPQICDEWAARDSRIRVIHKENAGAGMARNTGIELADGEYICFFDSDDWLEPDCVAQCYEAAVREKADIVCFGNDRVTWDGAVLERRIPNPPQTVFRGEEVLRRLMPRALSYDPETGEHWHLALGPWSAMYSLDRIKKNGWRFVSEREIMSEDTYSLLKLYACVQTAVILPKVLYHYNVTPASLSRTYSSERYEKVKHFCAELEKMCAEMGFTPYLKHEIAATYIGFTTACLKLIAASSQSYFHKLSEIKAILRDPRLQQTLREGRFSGENRAKKVLRCAMRLKSAALCHLIVKLRNCKGRVRT